MMKNSGGYYPANRQTPFAVLGCGMALAVGALFAGLFLMAAGMGC